ncbi:MAG: sel1 repeat family protein [Halochromatium sp.]
MADNSYLKHLVLLRNDPSVVPQVRAAAARGEVDAFYALGLIYAEGRGVTLDLAQAHYWLSLAIEQGDQDADLLRNIVGSRMSDDEYAAAQRLRAKPVLEIIGSKPAAPPGSGSGGRADLV